MSHCSTTSLHVDDVCILEIQERLTGPRRVVLTVVGEVDRGSCDLLSRALSRTWSARPVAVVVDLRHVTFLNAGGLHVLLLASRAARLRMVPFMLQAGPGQVSRLLTLVGLGEQLLTPDDVRAVLAASTTAPRPVPQLVPGADGSPPGPPPAPDAVEPGPGRTARPGLRLVPAEPLPR